MIDRLGQTPQPQKATQKLRDRLRNWWQFVRTHTLLWRHSSSAYTKYAWQAIKSRLVAIRIVISDRFRNTVTSFLDWSMNWTLRQEKLVRVHRKLLWRGIQKTGLAVWTSPTMMRVQWIICIWVPRSLRWGWSYLWRGIRWFARWTKRQVWNLARYLGRQLVLGIRLVWARYQIWRGASTRNYVIVIGAALAITAVVIWIIVWISSLIDTLGSIEFGLPENWNLLYIALTFLAFGVLFWLYRAGGTLVGVGSFLLGAVKTVFVLALLVILGIALGAGYAYLSTSGEKAGVTTVAERQVLIDAGGYPCPFNFDYLVTREWGKTVTRPAGCDFAIERKTASVGYEMAATTKEHGDVLVSISPGKNPEKTMVVNDLISFRLRIMEEETENEVPVMVSLYRR